MNPISSDPANAIWDVVIVGAGSAGLSAALTLGRCRRQVLLLDRGTPRNWASKSMHGFLTRDGVATEQFLALALGELKRYPSVTMDVCEVALAKRTDSGFEVRLTTGEAIHSRRLLLATGLFDELPKIPGIEDYFGISVFQCPYCDGWEVQDQTLVGYGKGERGIEMARALTAWSNDIILCLDGSGEIPPEESAALLKDKIRIFEQPVVAIHGKKGVLESLEIVDGTRIHAKTMLF